MSLSPSAQKVQDTLAALGFANQVIEFEQTTRTSAEAAPGVGCEVGQIAKQFVILPKNRALNFVLTLPVRRANIPPNEIRPLHRHWHGYDYHSDFARANAVSSGWVKQVKQHSHTPNAEPNGSAFLFADRAGLKDPRGLIEGVPMSKTIVMKFGGTSVGSAEAIVQSAAIVQAAKRNWDQVAVIVSAMSGVTDALLKGAHSAATGDGETYKQIAKDLRAKHEAALNGLVETRQAEGPHSGVASLQETIKPCLAEFESLCHAVHILGEASPRAIDAIASLGERMSIHLMVAYLRELGVEAEAVEATELILTDDLFGSANPQMAETKAKCEARLRPFMQKGGVPVITGFIGATQNGAITTLGRGGSDYSAGILGAALDADEVWIWTDVNGVMTADPRVAPDAQTLPELSFREISELAYYGAKVLHPKTIRPVVERGIALWIKNTFNPSHPGTLIVPDNGPRPSTTLHSAQDARRERQPPKQSGVGVAGRGASGIKAVTAIKGQSLITIEGRGMLGVPGVAARTFGAVARSGVSVTLITQASSEQSICFSVPSTQTGKVITALEDEFRLELARKDIDSIAALNDSVIVTVVGAGMKYTPGIAGKVFSALGDQNVNVIAIAQGSSECAISLVVEPQQAAEAVRSIHALIVNK